MPLSVGGSHSNYPILTAQELFNSMNTPTTMSAAAASASYITGSPSALLPPNFLYPHLYSGPSNYTTNLYLPSGEVRTYEVLGQRSSDLRVDRSVMSPNHLSIERPLPRRDNRTTEERMDTSHSSESSRSPPRLPGPDLH